MRAVTPETESDFKPRAWRVAETRTFDQSLEIGDDIEDVTSPLKGRGNGSDDGEGKGGKA